MTGRVLPPHPAALHGRQSQGNPGEDTGQAGAAGLDSSVRVEQGERGLHQRPHPAQAREPTGLHGHRGGEAPSLFQEDGLGEARAEEDIPSLSPPGKPQLI